MADGLARKYRPHNINEYLGEGVKAIVRNRFTGQSNYPNVILLYGTHGCGKTSCARLLAMEYLCQSKVDGHACGKCEICQTLIDSLINAEAGVENELYVREIDIASEGSKGNIDDIINDSLIEPVYVNYKILIMDEFHVASKQVQNRLLKIMEEPPKHLIFILCTTNPESIIDTIHSRCQLKIEVKKAKLDDLVKRMLFICQQENIITSTKALRLIAQKSDRIPRDTLMLLEQIALNYGKTVTLDSVFKYLSEIATDIYYDYFKSANRSLEDIMLFISKLRDRDITYKKFIKGLTQFVLDSIKIIYGINIEEYPNEHIKIVKSLLGIYNNDDLDYLLQIIELANKSIDASDEKLELTIVNTAMRIGKIKYFSDLSNIDKELCDENQKAKQKRSKVIREDRKPNTIVEPVSLSTIGETFGYGVTELVPDESDKKIYIPFDDNNNKVVDNNTTEDEEDEDLSDEDIFNMLDNLI